VPRRCGDTTKDHALLFGLDDAFTADGGWMSGIEMGVQADSGQTVSQIQPGVIQVKDKTTSPQTIQAMSNAEGVSSTNTEGNSGFFGQHISAVLTAGQTDKYALGVSRSTDDGTRDHLPFRIMHDGKHYWGPGGTSAQDVSLQRYGAATLEIPESGGGVRLTSAGGSKTVRLTADGTTLEVV
jgi:hypothetical protein